MAKYIKNFLFFLLTAFTAAVVLLVAAGLTDRIENADVIVVPGNTVGLDGQPGPRLRARLDAALALWRQGYAPFIFVSGGVGKEGFDEAQSMYSYLVAHGVRESAVIRDAKGIDTAATARNIAAFLHDRHLRTALVATQYFHVPRTILALQRCGVDVKGHMHGRFIEL